MPTNENNYNYIKEKIYSLKESFSSLKNKSEDYIFTILSVKSNFYKNPSLNFGQNEIENLIVDGVSDGGVDALLTDPNSDESNLVLCQSKYYKEITFEKVKDAVLKMALFYKSMLRGEYESVNKKVQNRFITLNAEASEDSKVCFVFYTSAPKSGIRRDRIEKALSDTLNNCCKFELFLYFDEDIIEEIKESESRRPTVESGKIKIDEPNNYLIYDDGAAIVVNVSAFSIKELYAIHNNNLLSRNLRYHITAKLDKEISSTIKDSPETFWFKNNGITMICEDYDIDGKYVKLKNFSIINGGQTTYLLHRSKEINKDHDFYLPCKIIQLAGENEDEKNAFSLEIAKATNSQKAIKTLDLKANAPEQVRFASTMREIGIFYSTKRGESIPVDYKNDYLNTDLAEVGKLSLAAIFQLPATSRNKPSALYAPEYYDFTFDKDQQKIARLIKDLLYIDYYFKNHFLKKFDDKNENSVYSDLIPFAHNARTLCIAFVAFASRFKQKNLNINKLKVIFDNIKKENAYLNYYYDIFKDIDNFGQIFPNEIFEDKDKCDDILFKLFEAIIFSGRKCFAVEKRHNESINESNYLKKDINYFSILGDEWDTLEEKINNIFGNMYEE